MKSFFAKNMTMVGIAVAVIAAGTGYWYIRSSVPPTFGQITVNKGNVIESVDDPGIVMAENNVAIAFQEGGQIATVNVSEGSNVSAGTVLATLDTSQLSAALQQADAAVATAQANLAEIASGTRPEQIQIDQSAVTSADQALGIAVENGYSAGDDAVTNQIDNLFSNAQSANPQFLIPNTNSQLGTMIQGQRVAIGMALDTWYAGLNASGTDPATLVETANDTLQQIEAYINAVALAVNGAGANGTVSGATLTEYKTDVATARTEVEASISAVSGAQSALTAAQNVLTLAQEGSTPQQIAAQQAVVDQAQAGAASAQVALNNASLVAPFSGTVQDLTAQVGQVVSPGVPVLSLVNNNGLKVETYVSEADVAKVAVGDAANVTLDAFGTGTVFPATVTTVDAAETQVNGSPAYEVTLLFVNPPSTVKDGMSGNVQIIAAEHDNVVEVPSNLVINNGNDYFVLVQDGNTTRQQPVQIGLVGDNNMTEITSGLNVGDTITNF